tara:strand:- start:412 stop:1197 length:786 start_codon:yes stop_codon:yes gene_type:complete
MFINNFDPIAFKIIFFEIRWYSLAYVFGIIFGWIYVKKKLLKKDSSLGTLFDDLVTYLVIGIILGGRLGYIIFYNPRYYYENFVEIFMIWTGGMSFHGGLIGIFLSTLIFSNKYKINKYLLLDLIAVAAPIGIFLGRIANFINSELIGKVTNVPWAVIFINIDNSSRHPSQLYEAFLEGIILFVILNYIFIKQKYKAGICSSAFCIFYGIFRIITEFFREPDLHLGNIVGPFSMGMILSFVLILTGIFIYYNENKDKFKKF